MHLQQVAEGFRLVEADPNAGHDPLPSSIICKLGLMDWHEVTSRYAPEIVLASALRTT
jgi:hypothetical protein